jgi:hypothetical protein
MKIDRVGISERLLNKYYAKKYTQEPYADNDALHHFKYHSGHCYVCHIPLVAKVYPYDVKEHSLMHLPACETHEIKLKKYDYEKEPYFPPYTDKTCPTCGVTFKTYREFPYCSLNCKSINSNQERKVQKITAICKHCRNEFRKKRSDSIFCSSICRAASHRNKDRTDN